MKHVKFNSRHLAVFVPTTLHLITTILVPLMIAYLRVVFWFQIFAWQGEAPGSPPWYPCEQRPSWWGIWFPSDGGWPVQVCAMGSNAREDRQGRNIWIPCPRVHIQERADNKERCLQLRRAASGNHQRPSPSAVRWIRWMADNIRMGDAAGPITPASGASGPAHQWLAGDRSDPEGCGPCLRLHPACPLGAAKDVSRRPSAAAAWAKVSGVWAAEEWDQHQCDFSDATIGGPDTSLKPSV